MSYDFAAAGSEMGGTLTTTKTVGGGLTIAAWIKYANHPESIDWIATLNKDANNDEYITLQTSATADRIDVRQADASSGEAAFHTSSVGEYDGVWVPVVGTFESTTTWNIFVELITNTHERSGSRDPGAMGVISIGDNPAGSAHWINKIAEVAMWDAELSNANVTNYLNGNIASGIDASNLFGYWAFDTDRDTEGTYLNAGNDATGDLTITNAVYAADHPTIISGGIIPQIMHHRNQQGN